MAQSSHSVDSDVGESWSRPALLIEFMLDMVSKCHMLESELHSRDAWRHAKCHLSHAIEGGGGIHGTPPYGGLGEPLQGDSVSKNLEVLKAKAI